MNKAVVCIFSVIGVVLVQGGRSLTGKTEVLDINSIYTCRLNNCTEVEFVLGDFGAAQKSQFWKAPERGGGWSTTNTRWKRKLLSNDQQQIGCVSQEEDEDLYFKQQSLRPCCEEFTAEKDFESVCEIADRFGLNCDYFREVNDVKEEYVTTGSVFQVC